MNRNSQLEISVHGENHHEGDGCINSVTVETTLGMQKNIVRGMAPDHVRFAPSAAEIRRIGRLFTDFHYIDLNFLTDIDEPTYVLYVRIRGYKDNVNQIIDRETGKVLATFPDPETTNTGYMLAYYVMTTAAILGW